MQGLPGESHYTAIRFSELLPQVNPLATLCSFVVAFCSLHFVVLANPGGAKLLRNVPFVSFTTPRSRDGSKRF